MDLRLGVEKDIIDVELQPEKKGLLLKHWEYTVTSKSHRVSVQRRYNDFVSFHEILLMRYPYRIVPKLPPKKVVASTEFIQNRRRALKRFLNLIARHPVISQDQIVTYFLTFSGSDVGSKIKEQYKGVPDEFMTNAVASQAKELVPADTQQNLASSRQQIYTMHRCIEQMRNVVTNLATRSSGNASDMMIFSQSVSMLAGEASPITSWATGGINTWQVLRSGIKSLVTPFAVIARKSEDHATNETVNVADRLELFLDLTTGYKDLIERHEKGVLRDHQLALHKMQQYKQRHMNATVRNNDSVDTLEHRIVEQEGAIHTMENRNYFSLYCLQMETQFIHSNMTTLVEMLCNLVDIEMQKHCELLALWEDIKAPVQQLAASAQTTTPQSPSTSQTPSAPPLFG